MAFYETYKALSGEAVTRKRLVERTKNETTGQPVFRELNWDLVNYNDGAGECLEPGQEAVSLTGATRATSFKDDQRRNFVSIQEVEEIKILSMANVTGGDVRMPK